MADRSLKSNLSDVMSKPAFCIVKTKVLICWAIITQLISAFGFATIREYNPYISKSENCKSLPIFCCGVARFASDLVQNPEDRFSHDVGHLSCTVIKPTMWLFAHHKSLLGANVLFLGFPTLRLIFLFEHLLNCP